MENWYDILREDHEGLRFQTGALDAAVRIDVAEQDRRVVLSWIVRNLWPALELHLRKEEEVLFPALARLLGEEASALILLKQEHEQLRHSLRHLAELVQDLGYLDKEAVELASDGFLEVLEDHEAKEERLLLDVLEFNLNPAELKTLAQAFKEVARKAYDEEGWPKGGSQQKTLLMRNENFS